MSTGVQVVVERERVWLKCGAQSFMLAYEAETDVEREWYASQLRGALSTFTPDVKTAPAAPAPEPLTDEQADEVLFEIDRMAREYDNYEYGLPLHAEGSRERFREVLRRIAASKEAGK